MSNSGKISDVLEEHAVAFFGWETYSDGNTLKLYMVCYRDLNYYLFVLLQIV
jgi:hypothetical protein